MDKGDPSHIKYLRLLAFGIAAKLPDDEEEARYVLTVLAEIVDKYLADKPPVHLVPGKYVQRQ